MCRCDSGHCVCAGVTGGTLPVLHWSCATAESSEADNADAVAAVGSSCPASCDSHATCDRCMSSGVHCVWSVLQQRVCTSSHPAT